jgi:DsbC/DsbD-like thiol-disulfide interchange protein
MRFRKGVIAMKPLCDLLLAGVLAATGVLIADGIALGQEKKSDSKVTATAEKPDGEGKQIITITIDVDKGWHAYANPVKHDDLVDAQTDVKITGKKALDSVQIDYPPGKLVTDKTFGNYQAYEGKVTIKATVKRAKGDTDPIQVTVKYQECNGNTCRMPAKVNLEVK